MDLRHLFRIIFSAGFGSELRALTKLAWPTAVASVLEYIMWMVPIVFCGHVGKIQLDAVTLAFSVVNVTGISLGFGLASACDTLMAQTFGSSNKMRVGIILQRSILILLLCCLPCWSLYLNTEKLLLLIHQDPEVARLAGEFVTLFIPALPGVFLIILATKYLSTQGIVYPAMFINLAANILNVPANYLCIIYFGWGARGAALATGTTQYLLCIFMFLYIRVRKLHLQTWPGWRSDCLQEWGVYIRLAVAGLLMVCLEWWTYEIGTLLAGLLGTLELAAQGILLTIGSLNYMIPMAMGQAASIRVGNELGAGNPAQAKLAAKVGIFSFCCYAVVASTVQVSVRHVVGHMYTSDKDVVRLIGEVMPIVCATMFFDSVQAGCAGVLRGCGKQRLGAVITFTGFYVLGLPFIGLFMFGLHFGLTGLYMGLGLATIFQCMSFLVIISRMNWKQESLKAQAMAGVKPDEDFSHCNGSVGEEVGKLADQEDEQELHRVAAVCTSVDSNISGDNLHSKLNHAKEDMDMQVPNGDLFEMEGAGSQHSIQEAEATDMEPLLESLHEKEAPEAMVLSLEKLPLRVLICRRLLAVAACLAILTVGVLVREYAPDPHYSNTADCVMWTGNGSLPLNTTLPWCNATDNTPTASTFLDVFVTSSMEVSSGYRNSTILLGPTSSQGLSAHSNETTFYTPKL